MKYAIKMTGPVQQVLRAMLADPAASRYGLEISKLTGLETGTLYPVMARLETVGWVESSWEDPEFGVREGLPRRPYYQLTRDRAHDTTAYTTCTFAELNREFGAEITGLVAGIAALDQIKYQGSSTAAQAIAAAKAADRQVLAIKVADRLHNMRTVEFLPPDKQLRHATEARAVFVPAARLPPLGTAESDLPALASATLSRSPHAPD